MNAADEHGMTALHATAINGHVAIAQALLKHGAQVDVGEGTRDETALQTTGSVILSGISGTVKTKLARVEYYFADLLSVLESGRDQDAGPTREALRMEYPEEAEENDGVPPRAIHMPPNLYIIGTVNVDETTYAFSPKVLDRALPIEFTEVDFAGYPPATAETSPLLPAGQKAGLLEEFTLGCSFAMIDKSGVAAATVNLGAIGRRVAVHIALGINDEGRRRVLAVELAGKESTGSWRDLLVRLKERGLRGVEYVGSIDKGGPQAISVPKIR